MNANSQTQSPYGGTMNRERLNDVFHERAQLLAQRGHQEAGRAAKVPIVVIRIRGEHYGIELARVKQVFSRVPITPVPGADDSLFGVANLNGTLRSIIDLGAQLVVGASVPLDGYVVLVCARDKSIGLWVQAIEGVRSIDLETLVSIKEIATKNKADCFRGMTADRIVVINLEPLFDRLLNNVKINGTKHGGTET